LSPNIRTRVRKFLSAIANRKSGRGRLVSINRERPSEKSEKKRTGCQRKFKEGTCVRREGRKERTTADDRGRDGVEWRRMNARSSVHHGVAD